MCCNSNHRYILFNTDREYSVNGSHRVYPSLPIEASFAVSTLNIVQNSTASDELGQMAEHLHLTTSK